VAPVDDFVVGVVVAFTAEWRPADHAFKHDGTEGPPVAAEVVPFAGEHFGGDVVGCADGGVGELTTFFAPGVNLVAVGNCELDLIEGDGVAVVGSGFAVHELFVICLFVLLVETGGKTKVSKLDMPATIKEDVVWFDVTGIVSICRKTISAIDLPMNETKLVHSFYSQD